jgi:Na+/H+ antiporter NhaB
MEERTVPAIIEMLAIAALIITVVAGLFQIYDRFTKTKKKSDE